MPDKVSWVMVRIHGLTAIQLYLLLVFTLLFWNCSKNTNEPPPPPAPPDTTSHDFVWQVTFLGELTSSLSDVFAIKEDDIWVVGIIHAEDSAGNEVVYNAAHWDGQEWKLRRIPFTGICSTNQFPPLRAGWIFARNDIWFARAGSLAHYDGITYTNHCGMNPLLEDTINKIWASANDNLYIVAGKGIIIHYDGDTWQKQESFTTTLLRDVWGNSTGSSVWACGYASNNSESILLRYDGNQWQTVWHWQYQQGASDSTYVGLFSSLWAFDPDSLIIVSGDGVFRQDIHADAPPRTEPLNLDAFPLRVRGSAANNIFICGDNGRIWHYNGATWKSYPELHNSNWVFYSITVLENKVIAVGEDYSQGIQRDIIVTGSRP